VTDPSTVPRGADMRAVLPPVRDQGQRGTCVAFAVTAVHEVARAAGNKVSEDLSEEALFWGCKIIDGNWNSGTTFDTAASAIGATGQPLEAQWPYGSHRTAGSRYDPPSKPTADWHTSVLDRVSVDLLALRAEIDRGRPVVLGVTVFDTLFIPTAAGRIDAPTTGSPARGRHAVVAVGHGPSGLLIRNSWGFTWAVGGYGWLSNEYAEHHINEAWVIQPPGFGVAFTPQGHSTGEVYESH
jgi:C1A family cysteine protease